MDHDQAANSSNKTVSDLVSRQRAQLEFEETIACLHQKAVTVLYGSKNIATLHSLPNELLSEIFLHLVRQLEAQSKLHIWSSVLFVCCAWYKLAISTPQLWTTIYRLDSRFVRVALQRSSAALLTVIAPPMSWYTGRPIKYFNTAECQALIVPHLSQLRSLPLEVWPHHPIFSAEDLYTPNLEHLKLNIWCGFEEDPAAFRPLTRLRVPKLTSLDLDGLLPFIEFKAWLPPNLTSLRLSTCIFSTINEFLDAIRSLSALKFLIIDCAQFQTPFAESSPPVVHLPRLCSLEVVHECPEIYTDKHHHNYSDILRFFSIPPTTKFYHCDWFVMDDSDACLSTFRFIENNTLLPLHGTQQNICATDYPRALRVYIDSDTLWFVVWTTEVSLDSLRLDYDDRECDYDQYAKLRVKLGPNDVCSVPGMDYLEQLLSQYDLRHVETLALCLQLIHGVNNEEEMLPTYLWLDLMRHMPNLQYFFTDSLSVMDHFQPSDEETVRGENDHTPLSRLYPSLRVICYEVRDTLTPEHPTICSFVRFGNQLRDEKSHKLEWLELRLTPEGQVRDDCFRMLVDADIADVVTIDTRLTDELQGRDFHAGKKKGDEEEGGEEGDGEEGDEEEGDDYSEEDEDGSNADYDEAATCSDGDGRE